SEVAFDERELHDSEVVHGEFLEARENSPALLKPTDALFDDRALAVLLSVEDAVTAESANLVLSLRDDALDLAAAEPVANRAVAVSLVASDSLRERAPMAQV